MKPNVVDALKTLADLAIGSCGDSTDPLTAYDAIATVGQRLADGMARLPDRPAMEQIAQRAAATASAIREADRLQLEFRDMLNFDDGGAAK